MTATTVPMTWGPHHPPLRGLSDVATVSTSDLRRVRLRLTEAARDRTLAVVTGSAGSGKSFSVGRAAETIEAKLDTEVIWVELASSASEKALLEDLYIQITGGELTGSIRAVDLRRQLQRVLAEKPRLLIVDEAQHASQMALRNLRWLHDKVASDFALAIVGTPPLWKTLPPEVRSRTAYHVEVSRIADAKSAQVLSEFHPMLAAIDPVLLSAVNRQQARGSFRWWAKFLANALNLAGTVGALTDANLHVYLADMDGA